MDRHSGAERREKRFPRTKRRDQYDSYSLSQFPPLERPGNSRRGAASPAPRARY